MKYSFFIFFVAMVLGHAALAGGIGRPMSVSVPLPEEAVTTDQQAAIQNYLVDRYRADRRNGYVFKAKWVAIGKEDFASHLATAKAFMTDGSTRYFVMKADYDYGRARYSVQRELAAPPEPIVDTPEPGPKEHCRPGECWHESARSASVR